MKTLLTLITPGSVKTSILAPPPFTAKTYSIRMGLPAVRTVWIVCIFIILSFVMNPRTASVASIQFTSLIAESALTVPFSMTAGDARTAS